MLLHSMYDYSMLDILYSIPIWLFYIPFLLFAILLPCIWHLSFVHAGFSLCNALFHSSFYHYSYSVLPLFLLRHAIIASSMLIAIIHPDGAVCLVFTQEAQAAWYELFIIFVCGLLGINIDDFQVRIIHQCTCLLIWSPLIFRELEEYSSIYL